MMKYEYVNTGIEWIGEIPKHWNVTTIKKEFQVIPSNVDKKTEDDETEVKLCNYVDVYYNDFINPSLDFMVASATDNEINKFQLKLGDVLITKDSEDPFDIAVPALVKHSEDKLLCGYHLSMIRSINNRVDGSFLFWALKDEVIATQLWRQACGVTRWAIASRHIKNSTIPFPPKPEQFAIASYLEKACFDLDRVLEIKRKQIENLQEQLKSIIYYTVSKGLNSKAEMKESNIDWIENVPKHWKIERLKDISRIIETGSTPPTSVYEYYENGTISWYGPSSFNGNVYLSEPVKLVNEIAKNDGELKMFETGSLMIIGIGATIGKTALISEPSSCNQQLNIFTPDEKILPEYLLFFMKRYEEIIIQIAQFTTLPIFNQTRCGSLNIAFPPKKEQKEIIDFLNVELRKVKTAQTKIEKQIETLLLYKKSIIHEVVTGKKQVYNLSKVKSKLQTA